MLAVRALAVCALALVAGCGAVRPTAAAANETFAVAPGVAALDTSCTGCNATGVAGAAAEQFSATLTDGGLAPVLWTVAGGDLVSGAGKITQSGLYTPPSYLTADSVQVVVTATLKGSALEASAVLTLSPGFMQPLSPENAAIGPHGSLTLTAFLAEAGGTREISFQLASAADGSGSGQGTLGPANCHHSADAFTECTASYTAPLFLSSGGSTWLVAHVKGGSATTAAQILLNPGGVVSNPLSHEEAQSGAILLGSSGGNNKDYDQADGQILDCCSGTLGALVADSSGRQFVLGNNHVLARSDHAALGELIVQPGLIDSNCTPYTPGSPSASKASPIGELSGFLPLKQPATNADAALVAVRPGAVHASGAILELGEQQTGGALAAAAPGVSSTGGRGEQASLWMRVAKSGRTTGLTCGTVSALALDVEVAYFADCAESKPYLTKIFHNQLGLSGNQFTDAGDSGALVVDAANAEPVGLFFAGGLDLAGVTQAVATPAPELLAELDAKLGKGSSFNFVGGPDHPVSCLNYGNGTLAAAEARVLALSEAARLQRALAAARALVNPSAGVLGVAASKSRDRAGEAAVLFTVDAAGRAAVPLTVEGVRTVVLAGVQPGGAAGGALPGLAAAVFTQAISIKQQVARELMRDHAAFFAVGVGESLDDTASAALVVYVDRHRVPAVLPPTVSGLRVRYVFMDRFHVTRSWLQPNGPPPHCGAAKAAVETGNFGAPGSLEWKSMWKSGTE